MRKGHLVFEAGLLSLRTALAYFFLLTASAFGATSVSQFGITWTFSADCQTGQYANGDYWVVGPVNIITITNNLHTNGILPSVGLDGSMINPGTDAKQGYDNRLTSYLAVLNKALINGAPISPTNVLALPVNSSLISSVSWIAGEPGCPALNGGTGEPRPVLRSAAVLTCVSNAPPSGTFRPPYCGTDKSPRFNKSQLDYSKLGGLAPVASTPALTNIERSVERPWIDHVYQYLGAMVHPTENMPQYGREFSYRIGEAALMLQLDFTKLSGNPSKEKLLIYFTQVGIDFAGIADNGGGWPSNGGHHMGRKWPILFAGVILNDTHMKSVGSWSTEFQEDLDTFYVSQAEVDITHGPTWKPDSRAPSNRYEVVNIGLPEWGIRHTDDPWADNLNWGATYRDINNQSYPGWVLAALIMGQRTAWNHEPLFDYIDRSTSIIDPDNPAGSNNYTTYYFGTAFMKNMWQAYRANYWPRWVPDNPADIYGQGKIYYSLSGGSSTDSDSDGIPDSWEAQHFGGSTNANPNVLSANGINTIYETYIAGLNPTNAQAVFAVSNGASISAMRWNAVSGRVYSVYWTTNLLSGFQPLETNIVWPQNSWTDTVHGAQADGFYQIKVHLGQ
jgi:hypothetical protein